MLRITKLTDYAIVVLTNMTGFPPAAQHTARDLADRTRIPQPTVSKILKDLSRGGILVSTRGVQGGYSLARIADSISLIEIIDAVDGPVAITECSSDTPANCEHAGACPVEANWVRINQVVRGALSTLSLADMGRPIAPPLIHLSRMRDGTLGEPARKSSPHLAQTRNNEEQS
ncbi:MAG TPA: SUF system Fe-S cluster assembly regulator [Polyangiaceae bacterium]|nr:SUF system Fe-S cluster assembly regulator [Polyangiaceae bacterium]